MEAEDEQKVPLLGVRRRTEEKTDLKRLKTQILRGGSTSSSSAAAGAEAARRSPAEGAPPPPSAPAPQKLGRPSETPGQEKSETRRMKTAIIKGTTNPKPSGGVSRKILSEDANKDLSKDGPKKATVRNAAAAAARRSVAPRSDPEAIKKVAREQAEKLFEEELAMGTWRGTAKRLAKALAFDVAVGCFIVVNFVIVIMRADHVARGEEPVYWMEFLEWHATWIYVLELLLRLAANGFIGFWEDPFNLLDFAICFVDVLLRMAGFFHGLEVNASTLRGARLLRLAKMIGDRAQNERKLSSADAKRFYEAFHGRRF
eukprot:TRINITY_DN102634_c0_g1_i1.p1 TRINITY_DN102634_c0_g1~~TRINITY_DN102634_c0_g1_i1.p1  ORF type:complete len:315 (-),score=97.20 TRINITY_DN102634_c0_g1_i1:571-1515(-)